MQIRVPTPTCTWCNDWSIVEVDADQFNRWQSGAFIQDAFPDLSEDVREMLISGTHPQCWDDMWGEE